MSVFLVATNDGTIEYDEDMYTALARVLLEMSGRVTGIAITEIEANIDQVDRDYETGGLVVAKADAKILNQHSVDFTVDQAKAVKQLHDLAQMAELVRDNLMTSILGGIHEKDVEPVRTDDIPASKKASVAAVSEALAATKH